MGNYAESNKTYILKARKDFYKTNLNTIQAINKLLVEDQGIDGITYVNLSTEEISDYAEAVKIVNGIRAHYESNGWEVESEIVNWAGTREDPVLVHETYIRITLK